MAKDRATSAAIEDVQEICGYVTTKEAARIVGLEWPTMSQVVYSKRVKAIRIGGIILVEKASAENYRKERQQIESENERKRLVREKLASLTPEQLEALLAQIEVKA
jgi:DNA repair protein RadC